MAEPSTISTFADSFMPFSKPSQNYHLRSTRDLNVRRSGTYKIKVLPTAKQIARGLLTEDEYTRWSTFVDTRAAQRSAQQESDTGTDDKANSAGLAASVDLLVERHGTADNNKIQSYTKEKGGPQDADLAEEGRSEASALGEEVIALKNAGLNIRAVMASPMRRTLETALRTFPDSRKVATEVWRELMEKYDRNIRRPEITGYQIPSAFGYMGENGDRLKDPNADCTGKETDDQGYDRVIDALEVAVKTAQILFELDQADEKAPETDSEGKLRMTLAAVTHGDLAKICLWNQYLPDEAFTYSWGKGAIKSVRCDVQATGDVTDKDWKSTITFTHSGPNAPAMANW